MNKLGLKESSSSVKSQTCMVFFVEYMICAEYASLQQISRIGLGDRHLETWD